MVIILAIILIGMMALLGFYIMRIEQRRKESIRNTIIASGKTDLTGVLSMYPKEMYDEVTEVYRNIYGKDH